jgi:hypothetical protein
MILTTKLSYHMGRSKRIRLHQAPGFLLSFDLNKKNGDFETIGTHMPIVTLKITAQ